MKLLLTGAAGFEQSQIDLLKEKLGCEIAFIQNEAQPPNDIIYEDIQAVVCNGLFLHIPIERFKSLQVVQATSAGLDRMPLRYIKDNGIKLFNARGVYSIPMAEWALLKTLELYKKSRLFYENQKNAAWKKQRNLPELFGKTVCIVGYGSVGRECAKRYKVFGCKIIAVDIASVQDKNTDGFYDISELVCAVQKSDVIVLTLPLTAETEGIINANVFNYAQENCVLINISRGAIIKEIDLLAALQSRRLAGAALDVFETEPLPADNPLWQHENVIVSPHNSFASEANKQRLFDLVLENLERDLF